MGLYREDVYKVKVIVIDGGSEKHYFEINYLDKKMTIITCFEKT